jgi:hypothetical protein
MRCVGCFFSDTIAAGLFICFKSIAGAMMWHEYSAVIQVRLPMIPENTAIFQTTCRQKRPKGLVVCLQKTCYLTY